MIIYLGADHRGFELKEQLKLWLIENHTAGVDLGAEDIDFDDNYTEYAAKVAAKVSQDPGSKGIIVCGSGVGVDIVANKFDGVRSGLGMSKEQIRSAREDDDINVLALASGFTNLEEAKEMVKVFLETEFKGEEKYQRRLDEIKEIEKEN